MNFRQNLLRQIYPIIMKFSRKSDKGKVLSNLHPHQTSHSLYDLTITDNKGKNLSLKTFKGQKILIVNTASNCGYTGQYQQLQTLHQQFPDLIILGAPANDFAEQEKSNDQEIHQFCQVNYGVTFPLLAKSQVIKGPDQNPLFHWLSHQNENGWNNQEPVWNFSKYLINQQGQLTHFFGPAISPLGEEIIEAIKA